MNNQDFVDLYKVGHDCTSSQRASITAIGATSLPLFDVLLVVRLLELLHFDRLQHEVLVLQCALFVLGHDISQSISGE